MRRATATVRWAVRWPAAHFSATRRYWASSSVFLQNSAEGAARRKQRGDSRNVSSGPVRDRFPPVLTDLSDPRRRLAVLVDASSLEPRVFINTILPAARKVGVPVLVRLFAVQLSGDWEPLVAGSGRGMKRNNTSGEDEKKKQKTSCVGNVDEAMSDGDAVAADVSACSPLEFFRVERFIPVSMQMEADANHIFDFRQQNKIEAICFACGEVDRGVFEGFLANIAGNGFNQYVLDELGMAKEVLEDGRSADGSACQ